MCVCVARTLPSPLRPPCTGSHKRGGSRTKKQRTKTKGRNRNPASNDKLDLILEKVEAIIESKQRTRRAGRKRPTVAAVSTSSDGSAEDESNKEGTEDEDAVSMHIVRTHYRTCSLTHSLIIISRYHQTNAGVRLCVTWTRPYLTLPLESGRRPRCAGARECAPASFASVTLSWRKRRLRKSKTVTCLATIGTRFVFPSHRKHMQLTLIITG